MEDDTEHGASAGGGDENREVSVFSFSNVWCRVLLN